ncbi:hypothetical protein AN640_00210 [Candidatus Epulonipiscium fishelsonii]|uniref:Uncharacterized protein n=1 Tax=Candidatus Epulonipiscium fishelsonii TaxID=77094 RepID=A0ACC8XIJ9_9FIRM|nr:hypothetical protein AN640_00210 [Epulopiscium sp. SCG-D08WGA-EpuloA1]OON94496.1 MAG: hypothetical protein ATN32_08125 [Epulopiscium sp. AS2M-Bin002]
MIKNTFNNLKPDKKKMILEKSIQVLCNTSATSIKVSDIINATGISRGSFYQYFDTPVDIFLAIIEELQTENIEIMKQIIKEEKGDFFSTFKRMFEFQYVNLLKKENEHIMLMLKKSNELIIKNQIFKVNDTYCSKKFMHKFDLEKLNINTYFEFNKLYILVTDIMGHNILNGIMQNLTLEKALEDYLIQLDFIKYGVIKREENHEEKSFKQ